MACPGAGWPDALLSLAGKPELPRQPGSTAQYDAETGSPDTEPTESESPQSSSTETNHFLHTLDWQEEKDSETGAESAFAQETPPAPAEDVGDSEPSDEDAATRSAGSRDTADEDSPDPAAKAPEQELMFDARTPATPQEPPRPEEGVDLLGLHSEAGPAPPAQAPGGPPSNADLLSCLMGAPEAAPEGPPGDLLSGETPLLFTSSASTTRGPSAAGRCEQ